MWLQLRPANQHGPTAQPCSSRKRRATPIRCACSACRPRSLPPAAWPRRSRRTSSARPPPAGTSPSKATAPSRPMRTCCPGSSAASSIAISPHPSPRPRHRSRWPAPISQTRRPCSAPSACGRSPPPPTRPRRPASSPPTSSSSMRTTTRATSSVTSCPVPSGAGARSGGSCAACCPRHGNAVRADRRVPTPRPTSPAGPAPRPRGRPGRRPR